MIVVAFVGLAALAMALDVRVFATSGHETKWWPALFWLHWDTMDGPIVGLGIRLGTVSSICLAQSWEEQEARCR